MMIEAGRRGRDEPSDGAVDAVFVVEVVREVVSGLWGPRRRRRERFSVYVSMNSWRAFGASP